MAGLGRRTHYRKHLTDSVLFDLPTPGPTERIAKIASTRGSNQFDVIVAAAVHTAAPPSDSPVDAGHIADAADVEPPVESYTQGAEKPLSEAGGSAGHCRNRVPQLAILPTKFRKLVWVKRNDYVIVETGSNSSPEEPSLANNSQTGDGSAGGGGGGGGIRYIISHILYKDQIKHLKAEGYWPSHDPEFVEDGDCGGGHHDKCDASKDDGYSTDDEGQASVNGGDNHGDNNEHCGSDVSDEDDDDGDLFVNTNRVATLRVDDSSSSDSEAENEENGGGGDANED
jgi:probable RNA-binding protein EIF1AD